MNIHITDFTGLCNRLEALAVALCIREYYGAEIYCRWPEADAFHIPHVRWNQGAWMRWRRTKLRGVSEEEFCRLSNGGNLYLRGIHGGPAVAKLRQLQWIREHIRLHPELVRRARLLLDQDKPVVGVHLRRGDFKAHESARHQALNDDWIRNTMDGIVERHPGTRFREPSRPRPVLSGVLRSGNRDTAFVFLALGHQRPWRSSYRDLAISRRKLSVPLPSLRTGHS